ncbi:hypothetical protein DRH13_00350 [Candidatus Woesebacteria bacterium]|nr:MAG: hypothetical protein DRH13_00350 [Candidatus Woesebacteria bacterium]
MNKGQNQTSIWLVIALVFVVGLTITTWNQHKKMKALETQMKNLLSYDLPIDNIVDLEKRVEANTHNQKNGMEVVWDILARLEPHILAKDPETNWTIVYKELADLKGRTSTLDGYIWDITYELTGSPLNAEKHYAYGNEMSGLSRIDQLYEEIWGARNNEALDANNPTFLECGYTSMKVDCPDSRIDYLYKSVYLDYAEDEPGINLVAVNRAKIDDLYENDILYLFRRIDDLTRAICEIEPETYPLCAQ